MAHTSPFEPAMTIKLEAQLPEMPTFKPGIRRASKRGESLSRSDQELALRNALRYVPPQLHGQLAPEFLAELREHGRIYAYRYRPAGALKGQPVDAYRGRCLEGRAFQVMIDNNLDFDVALYPYELVTYGETGQVCQNWLQYRLIKKYLEVLGPDQTLVVQSGHPLGLFHSHRSAPRVIMSNGLMVGMYDDNDNWTRAAALGVANYGQMTAGGWMYIGPQGIVHGTYNTLVIAARLRLGVADDGDLRGKLFVSSGLGGMSGAQGKAVMIGRGAGIIAEVDASRVATRRDQGWVSHVTQDPAEAFRLAREAQQQELGRAIAFHGNIVDLLEYAHRENEKIDLLSDQTSCHVVYDGGYCPQGLTFEERTELLRTDKAAFRRRVDQSLRRHFELVRDLIDRGTFFFDYGNAFLKAVYDSGVKEMSKNGRDDLDGFIWPSYVEDILGPELFDYGYGPFRWVCLSGDEEDLRRTDAAAAEVIAGVREPLRYQDHDNARWVRDAMDNRLVVGTQARILYQDARGRMEIALKFNDMVRKGEVGPIMLGRDHHDAGGTDSPFRETANIKDGSNIMSEMATHCFAGNAARGMSLVTLHNGGGVGIGKAINGGFGMVLDGSQRVDEIIRSAMSWDVLGGVARRAWARNDHAMETVAEHNRTNAVGDHITLPYLVDDELIQRTVDG
jgi:urocanate hydratase